MSINELEVKVFGQEGCGKCKSFMKKLEILKVPFEYDNLEKYTSGEMGINKEIMDLMVYVQFVQTDHIPLPVVKVLNEFYDYSGGIKRIKELLNNVQCA